MRFNTTLEINKKTQGTILLINYQNAFLSFVCRLFNDFDFSLGGKKFSVSFVVTHVERLSSPAFKPTIEFNTLLPLGFTTRSESKIIGYQNKFSTTTRPELIRSGIMWNLWRRIQKGLGMLSGTPSMLKKTEYAEMLETLVGRGCRSAGKDRRRGGSDYRSAGNDHRRAGNDYRSEGKDHRRGGNDY